MYTILNNLQDNFAAVQVRKGGEIGGINLHSVTLNGAYTVSQLVAASLLIMLLLLWTIFISQTIQGVLFKNFACFQGIDLIRIW